MPYVAYSVPKIDYKTKVYRRLDMDQDYLEQVNKRI